MNYCSQLKEPGSRGFPGRLRYHRKVAVMSQTELARLIGMTQPTIVEYEAGRRIPRVDTVEKIAKALKVQPNDLMQWK